jgi:hypothetical protein
VGDASAGEEIKNPIKPLMELVLANNRRPYVAIRPQAGRLKGHQICARQVLDFILEFCVFL